MNIEKLALALRENSADLIFKRYDTMNDEKMIDNYYFAYKDAFPDMRVIAVGVFAIWVVAFIFSSFVLLRGDIAIPYKVDKFTAAISLLFIVGSLWPYLIYGKSWPPRMF